jgi:hypothetical protein
MPGLAELVQRELARREEGDGAHPVFVFTIDDAADAMTNVAEAAKAVIADADARQHEVTVTPAIADAVAKALRAAYPRRMIMLRTVVESSMRHAGRPETEGYHVETDAAVKRAADRLAQLREGR